MAVGGLHALLQRAPFVLYSHVRRHLYQLVPDSTTSVQPVGAVMSAHARVATYSWENYPCGIIFGGECRNVERKRLHRGDSQILARHTLLVLDSSLVPPLVLLLAVSLVGHGWPLLSTPGGGGSSVLVVLSPSPVFAYFARTGV